MYVQRVSTMQTNEFEEGKQIFVFEWQNRQEQRTFKGKSQNVQITSKQKVHCTLSTLVEDMNILLKNKYCRHVFNITHQYRELSKLKENISENECILHIDFSENYACKIETEVQGMHFGASRNQVSLHTGVMYIKDLKPSSFCSISESTRHDPPSIWAHLQPVIDEIKTKFPLVNMLHCISDGPTTQYRSKTNFYLIKHKCVE